MQFDTMPSNDQSADDERSNERLTEKTASNRRRKFLRGAGIAGLTLVGATGGVAAKSKSRLDTSFNPNNKSAVENFILQCYKRAQSLSAKKRKKKEDQLKEQLSNKQQRAIKNVLANADFSTTHKSALTTTAESQAVATTSGYQQASYTDKVEAHLTVAGQNLHAFNFFHQIQWLYNGSKIQDPTATAWGTGKSYLVAKWEYVSASGGINIAYTHASFNSQKTGIFNRQVYSGTGYSTVNKDHAYSKLLGGPSGEHSVLDWKVY